MLSIQSALSSAITCDFWTCVCESTKRQFSLNRVRIIEIVFDACQSKMHPSHPHSCFDFRACGKQYNSRALYGEFSPFVSPAIQWFFTWCPSLGQSVILKYWIIHYSCKSREAASAVTTVDSKSVCIDLEWAKRRKKKKKKKKK